MRIVFTLLCAVLLGSAAIAAGSYHSMYARLGGYSGVHSLSSNLVNRLAADPNLRSYFETVTPSQRAALARYAAQYACKEAGAGCVPRMPRLAIVQNPPPLSASAKDAAIADLRQTLAAHRVPADIRFALLQAVKQAQ